ncbi:uncharacterized protein EAE97_001549 [Botrytis byssoidea]|uniref:Uncharacterized protein n=1 Tax=Botrytis byssoidea TaxID=139641 RepID=A0A9P5M2U7_9HELO|nr:uncharacterized protein EAE97_001549 [Botrytis byssoidea]KAF7952052.1 hypothetical protein EAE97_001549 [Botrytis byssoidea]
MTTTRQNVQVQDIKVGCILFLPSTIFGEDLICMWSDVNGHPCRNNGRCVLKQEGHDHPVVIIGKRYEPNGIMPSILRLSFVQMTHGNFRNASTSGPTIYSPYGHYEVDQSTGRLTFPQNFRSRYWFRGIEYLRRGPGNFRIPHVFFAPRRSFRTMTTGPQARAYDSRLDEGSYLRLMQRLNLEPKRYVLDHHLDDYWPALPNGDSAKHEQPSSHANTNRPSSVGQAFDQPHGHHIANRGCMEDDLEPCLAVPILDPAPCGTDPLIFCSAKSAR